MFLENELSFAFFLCICTALDKYLLVQHYIVLLICLANVETIVSIGRTPVVKLINLLQLLVFDLILLDLFKYVLTFLTQTL